MNTAAAYSAVLRGSGGGTVTGSRKLIQETAVRCPLVTEEYRQSIIGGPVTYALVTCFSKMQTDFGHFQERLEGACCARNMTIDALCNSTGLSSYGAGLLTILGIKALDIFELAQIAGTLNVSIDWLLGRTDQMELPEPKGTPA